MPQKFQSNAKMNAPVRTLYVRQPFRKATGNSGLKKRDLPHFYVNTVMRDQTAQEHRKPLYQYRGTSIVVFYVVEKSMLHWRAVDQAAPRQFPSRECNSVLGWQARKGDVEVAQAIPVTTSRY